MYLNLVNVYIMDRYFFLIILQGCQKSSTYFTRVGNAHFICYFIIDFILIFNNSKTTLSGISFNLFLKLFGIVKIYLACLAIVYIRFVYLNLLSKCTSESKFFSFPLAVNWYQQSRVWSVYINKLNLLSTK